MNLIEKHILFLYKNFGIMCGVIFVVEVTLLIKVFYDLLKYYGAL